MSDLREKLSAFISQLQLDFKEIGIWKGPVDGIWTDALDQKIRDYKGSKGLRNDRSLMTNLTVDLIMDDLSRPTPVADIDQLKLAYWIETGMKYLGLKEIPGSKHNPTILAWWIEVGATWFKDDETAWCALFIGAILKEAGLPILPASKVASSLAWAEYGYKLAGPAVGAICVKRRTGGGHVGLVLGRNTAGKLVVLSGNASNRVGIDTYNESDFFAYRYPIAPPAGLKVGFQNLPVLNVSSSGIVTEA